MRFSVQTDSVRLLKEAAKSRCDRVRFGPEFCEVKIPSLPELQKAYKIAEKYGKEFVYMTPRVTDKGIRRLKEHFEFLNAAGDVSVVVNDLGALRVLTAYPRLKPILGRQLVYMPARCPWLDFSLGELLRHPGFVIYTKVWRRRSEELYSQTNLNYDETAKFFRGLGVRGVDVDWIPRSFNSLAELTERGFNVNVYLYLAVVTLTRKCHTARFLGEKRLEKCSKPCDKRAFHLKHRVGLEFFLHGNVVFRLEKPSENDLRRLLKSKIADFVITMEPVMKILNRERIDETISKFKSGRTLS